MNGAFLNNRLASAGSFCPSILHRARLLELFVEGTFIAVITLLAFLYCLYGMDLNLGRARTLRLR